MPLIVGSSTSKSNSGPKAIASALKKSGLSSAEINSGEGTEGTNDPKETNSNSNERSKTKSAIKKALTLANNDLNKVPSRVGNPGEPNSLENIVKNTPRPEAPDTNSLASKGSGSASAKDSAANNSNSQTQQPNFGFMPQGQNASGASQNSGQGSSSSNQNPWLGQPNTQPVTPPINTHPGGGSGGTPIQPNSLISTLSNLQRENKIESFTSKSHDGHFDFSVAGANPAVLQTIQSQAEKLGLSVASTCGENGCSIQINNPKDLDTHTNDSVQVAQNEQAEEPRPQNQVQPIQLQQEQQTANV